MNSADVQQIVTKLKEWPVWKKTLCIAAALIISHGAIGVGTYIAGTKSLKPYSPPTIVIGKPDPVTVVNPGIGYLCGPKIDMTATFESNKKLKIVAKDNCKQTTAFFDVGYNCPEYKWTLGLSPGLLMTYSLEQSKFTWMVGGQLYFKRNYGRFSFGPALGYYQSIDSKNFGLTANLAMEYRF